VQEPEPSERRVKRGRPPLTGESDDQQTKDNETVSAFAKGHGYAESHDTQAALLEKLLAISQRSQPGEPPQSMAAALAIALFGPSGGGHQSELGDED